MDDTAAKAKLGTINDAQKPSDETAVSPMAAGFNSEGGSKKNGKSAKKRAHFNLELNSVEYCDKFKR